MKITLYDRITDEKLLDADVVEILKEKIITYIPPDIEVLNGKVIGCMLENGSYRGFCKIVNISESNLVIKVKEKDVIDRRKYLRVTVALDVKVIRDKAPHYGKTVDISYTHSTCYLEGEFSVGERVTIRVKYRDKFYLEGIIKEIRGDNNYLIEFIIGDEKSMVDEDRLYSMLIECANNREEED